MTVGFRDSRYIIGIDLGTTNSVVSYVDRYAENKSIETFPVMQIIASGESGGKSLSQHSQLGRSSSMVVS